MNTGLIDLSEIPSAQGGAENPERFEFFARAFLEAKGFICKEGPDRGADDGRDLVVEETIEGIVSRTEEVRRWVVSAKHLAHSGSAVSKDEDIANRCSRHNADGFIVFYSTYPSSRLARTLKGLDEQGLYFIQYDQGRITEELRWDPRLRKVFEHYLPESFARVNATEIEGRLHFYSSLAVPSRLGKPPELRGPEVIFDTNSGHVRCSEHELELGYLAAHVHNELKQGRFVILRPFVSFNERVWRYLCALLREDKNPVPQIGDAILKCRNPFQSRLLISIAGEARQFDALDPICRTVLDFGWKFHHDIAKTRMQVTPYLEVARRSLTLISTGQKDILEKYRAEAKARERWQQYRVFRRAATKE